MQSLITSWFDNDAIFWARNSFDRKLIVADGTMFYYIRYDSWKSDQSLRRHKLLDVIRYDLPFNNCSAGKWKILTRSRWRWYTIDGMKVKWRREVTFWQLQRFRKHWDAPLLWHIFPLTFRLLSYTNGVCVTSSNVVLCSGWVATYLNRRRFLCFIYVSTFKRFRTNDFWFHVVTYCFITYYNYYLHWELISPVQSLRSLWIGNNARW